MWQTLGGYWLSMTLLFHLLTGNQREAPYACWGGGEGVLPFMIGDDASIALSG